MSRSLTRLTTKRYLYIVSLLQVADGCESIGLNPSCRSRNRPSGSAGLISTSIIVLCVMVVSNMPSIYRNPVYATYSTLTLRAGRDPAVMLPLNASRSVVLLRRNSLARLSGSSTRVSLFLYHQKVAVYIHEFSENRTPIV